MTAPGTEFAPTRSPRVNDHPQSSGPEVTTLLICENALLRSGLQQILSDAFFIIEVGGSAVGSGPLQDGAVEPTLVIIEANQDTCRVLEVVKRVKQKASAARVVAVADHFEPSFVHLGRAAGIDGFCLATSAPGVLIKSLELVLLGEAVVPSQVIRAMLKGKVGSPEPLRQESTVTAPKLPSLGAHRLSTREAEILSCLREGAPNKVIARKLDVAEATVKVHVKAILRKIGAANRTQAALWAKAHLPPKAAASLHA